MARGRMVSRSIVNSEKLASLSCDGARLLFTWLIVTADNLGRVRAEPLQVKADVMLRNPATVKSIEAWLGEMAQLGLIYWYVHQNQRFAFIEGWDRHNKLSGNMASNSDLPDPLNAVCTPYVHRMNAVRTPYVQNSSARAEVEVEVEVEVEGEVEVGGVPPNPPVNGVDHVGVVEDRLTARQAFEDVFWPAYPRKVARQAALQSFLRLVKDGPETDDLFDRIMTGLRWYVKGEWAERPLDKVTHASTWLNQRRFDDAPQA